MTVASLAAPLHRGVVRASFDAVQGVQLLSYRVGQVVHVDTPTRATMEAAGGDVHWADQDVVPGLAFARPMLPLTVAEMRPGTIYAADALDGETSKAAFEAGRIASVTVSLKGGDASAERIRGWVMVR